MENVFLKIVPALHLSHSTHTETDMELIKTQTTHHIKTFCLKFKFNRLFDECCQLGLIKRIIVIPFAYMTVLHEYDLGILKSLQNVFVLMFYPIIRKYIVQKWNHPKMSQKFIVWHSSVTRWERRTQTQNKIAEAVAFFCNHKITKFV